MRVYAVHFELGYGRGLAIVAARDAREARRIAQNHSYISVSRLGPTKHYPFAECTHPDDATVRVLPRVRTDRKRAAVIDFEYYAT